MPAEAQHQSSPTDPHTGHAAAGGPLGAILAAYHAKPRLVGRASDVVTVVVNDYGRANKLIRRIDGETGKIGATTITRAHAAVVPVPNALAMVELLMLVGAHPEACLILGPPIDAPQGAFRVLSQRAMAKALGLEPDGCNRGKIAGWHQVEGEPATCRLKSNFLRSSWIVFDRDSPDGTPEEWWACPAAEWIMDVASVLPGFLAAGKVILPSTSSRVHVDGAPYAASPNLHIFVQVEDSEDIERFVNDAFLAALAHGLVFLRPNRAKADRPDGVKAGDIIGHTPTTIWDVGAMGAARLVYDGKPAIEGQA